MQAFYALIDRLDRSQGDEKAALERMLWDTFGVDACVLALDMSGFSRTVRADGIIAYLAHIRRMQQVSTPIVVASGGEVVKYTADNLMAVFDSAVQAVNAAREIRQACLSMAEPLQVSIGMANGRFLYVPHTDCFGDPVNVAFKLAEDVAANGEILVTEDVLRLAPASVAHDAWLNADIAGLQLRFASVH
ncbi:MAG: adenylate/guanylate cyclase domain-containing protein [Gammaproteobacteria bacterium]